MIEITERGYEKLKVVALLAALMPLAYLGYQAVTTERAPGEVEATAGDRAFQDGRYETALAEYRDALDQAPEHGQALLGLANTLTQTGDYREAIAAYNRYLEDVDPEFAGAYANRGIAYDRMGNHEQALADYRKAQELDPSVDDGPGWLTKFLHMGPEGQPTIGDRADYLEAQLALPPDERELTRPDIDEEQRSYTQRVDGEE